MPNVTIPADLAREVAKIADPRVRAEYQEQLRKHARILTEHSEPQQMDGYVNPPMPDKWGKFRKWVAGERKKGRK